MKHFSTRFLTLSLLVSIPSLVVSPALAGYFLRSGTGSIYEGQQAKYYYELGNAFVGKSDNEAACDAYKNAMFGAYAENAKYQVETVLKCK